VAERKAQAEKDEKEGKPKKRMSKNPSYKNPSAAENREKVGGPLRKKNARQEEEKRKGTGPPAVRRDVSFLSPTTELMTPL
jgi:hypothetical protein